MFTQAAERFADVVEGLKRMAGDMQRELETTRAELRKGILELPQETAESAAQMRRVIVDQIEALAELNRIVARHGRGLDAVEPARAGPRRLKRRRRAASAREEPALANGEPAPEPPPRAARRHRRHARAAAAPMPRPRRRRQSPRSAPPRPDRRRPHRLAVRSAHPRLAGGRAAAGSRARRAAARSRASAAERRPASATGIESLDSLAVDIARMIDHDAAAELWDRYKRGERNVFTRKLYTMQGQKAFEEIRRKYRGDRDFKQTVDRYIVEFERLLEEVSRDDRGQVVARTYLTSETGKVYTMLAHAAGRFD